MSYPVSNDNRRPDMPEKKREAGTYVESDSAKKKCAKTKMAVKKQNVFEEAQEPLPPRKRTLKRERELEASEEAEQKKGKASTKKRASTTDEMPNRVKKAVAPTLKRTKSASSLDQVEPEEKKKAQIAKVSGELWECFERTSGPSGGFLYHYKMKPEFTTSSDKPPEERKEAIKNKLEEIFPAIESCDETPPGLINISSLLADAPILKKLGYSYDSETGILTLPDIEALRNGWSKLQEEDPNLPNFDVVLSEGIADDITFITSYLMHDALLSTGKEFVHDHLFHVISAIKIITSFSDSAFYKEHGYNPTRMDFVKATLRCLRRLDWGKEMLFTSWPKGKDEVVSNGVTISKLDLQKLEKALGAVVDSAAAGMSNMELSHAVDSFTRIHYKLNSFGWSIVRDRLYGTEYDTLHLEEVWDELGRLENAYLEKIIRDKA